MSFQQGLSGLNAASRNLEVIGNNVANANTVGFKQSRAQFADVYASTLAGTSQSQVGIGVNSTAVVQTFAQGNINITNNALDLAVNGEGFYRLSNNGTIVFSRAGQFQTDKDGFIVNSQSENLTGYPVDALGNISQTSSPVPLRISTSDIQPKTTSSVGLTLSLDARAQPPATATFNSSDPTSFNNTTTVQVFDSLGNPHNLTTYYLKTATAGQWTVRAQLDGANVMNGATPWTGTLSFTAAGVINTGATTIPALNLVPLNTAGNPTGATSPQAVTLGFSGSTQFGSAFGVTAATQDGYGSGRLLNVNVSSDGVILGRYSNGQTRPQGQVVLASFASKERLQPLGSSGWAETGDSGPPLLGVPETGLLGTLQAGALEESNVDLTAELVNMITAQRGYQANAQTIRTQDQLLQTLVTLR